ncbi:MAG: cupin domain-containing protein [Candidatus Latescibacterota bacterium]
MRFIIFLLAAILAVPFAAAQNPPDYSRLDPNPYDPKSEPNIDMFISSWLEGAPYQTYGGLVERDILSRLEGDPLQPTRRGAVLEYLNRFTYAVLSEHASTAPSTLKGEQVIFYIDSGKGVVKAGGKTAELHEGVGALMPEGVEFTLSNTGDVHLAMYVIAEPVPAGFKPGKEMIVKDENTIPVSTTKSHWSHIPRVLFYRGDPMATLSGACPIWFAPMTLGQPHSHGPGEEEIWFMVKGEINLLLGKQLRKLTPGMAYKIPPNGITPHSNINTGDEMVKMFWLMRVPKK